MFDIPAPTMQIDFAGALAKIRSEYLQDALFETVKGMRVSDLDRQLAAYVPDESLAALASSGLRGELVFPIPIVLETNPYLLGYYRLLYGFSQKEFYRKEIGVSRFHPMEKRGFLSETNAENLEEFCEALIDVGAVLLQEIGPKRITQALLDDLTLLTLGPQLRGGANVVKGANGIRKVFEAIHEIVKPQVERSSGNKIEILNAAKRNVLIEFAPDPDIVIREEMNDGEFRELIAIEVKAGADFSNIHNRIGEAEKSHQKAKDAGYSECWTVVNVDRIDMVTAKKESPTTNRFYRISDLVRADGPEYSDFRSRVISLTGIPTPK